MTTSSLQAQLQSAQWLISTVSHLMDLADVRLSPRNACLTFLGLAARASLADHGDETAFLELAARVYRDMHAILQDEIMA